MNAPLIKIKVLPKPVIKGKMDVRFPAHVQVVSPILLNVTAGVFTFSIDMNSLIDMLSASIFGYVDREINAAGDVTIQVTDDLVRINKTVSQATTAYLPPSNQFKKTSLVIKDQKGDTTNFKISITPNGSETIDGQAGARVIDWPYGAFRLRPVVGGWLTLP